LAIVEFKIMLESHSYNVFERSPFNVKPGLGELTACPGIIISVACMGWVEYLHQLK